MYGSITQTEALEILRRIGNTKFQTYNGWLESFKNCSNDVRIKVYGKVADINMKTVDEWKKNLLQSFMDDVTDIYIGDEQNYSVGRWQKKYSLKKNYDTNWVAGKMAKEGLTAFMCANMADKIEKPAAIGTLAKSHCYRNINRDLISMTWKSNKKSWMTSAITEEWLQKLNLKIKKKTK